jgi:DNA-binding transcriptional LysR family regulator
MSVDSRVLRRLKLNDLRLFQAVVEFGGMAKAASRLNISQPAVSKAIASLENTLKVRLLDRTPQGVEPTQYGQALLDGGVAVFDELTKSVKQIEYLADPTSGEVRIGCTEAGAAGFVPAVIRQLTARYPRVVFRITTADPMTLVSRDLAERRVELVIGAIPEPIPHKDVEVTFLFDDRHVVMAGEQNKWVRRRKIKLTRLMAEPWVLPPPESDIGRAIGEIFRKKGVELPQKRVETFSIPLSHHLLATGQFLTMHPVVMARLGNYLPLRRLDVEFAGVNRRVGVMVVRRRTLSPLARVVIDCAHELAKPLAKLKVELSP